VSNLYEALGVEKDASKEEIKKSYRKKSKAVHPDTNKGKTGKEFVEINKAYQVLSNPNKKRLYDEGKDPESETKTENSIEDKAMDYILDEFSRLITDGMDDFFKEKKSSYNYVSMIRKVISSSQKEMNENIKKIKSYFKFIKKNKKRVKCKKGKKNLYILALEDVENIFKKQEYECKEKLEVFKLADKILKYHKEKDIPIEEVINYPRKDKYEN